MWDNLPQVWSKSKWKICGGESEKQSERVIPTCICFLNFVVGGGYNKMEMLYYTDLNVMVSKINSKSINAKVGVVWSI